MLMESEVVNGDAGKEVKRDTGMGVHKEKRKKLRK